MLRWNIDVLEFEKNPHGSSIHPQKQMQPSSYGGQNPSGSGFNGYQSNISLIQNINNNFNVNPINNLFRGGNGYSGHGDTRASSSFVNLGKSIVGSGLESEFLQEKGFGGRREVNMSQLHRMEQVRRNQMDSGRYDVSSFVPLEERISS
jgi:hypothetical protein